MGGQGTFGAAACQYANASGLAAYRYRLRPLFRSTADLKAACRLSATWSRCVGALESELPEQQFNTWVRPLQAVESNDRLRLLAPNRFVVDWVRANLLTRIEAILRADGALPVTIEIGSRELPAIPGAAHENSVVAAASAAPVRSAAFAGVPLNANFTFGSFIEGKSNHFAKAAAQQA